MYFYANKIPIPMSNRFFTIFQFIVLLITAGCSNEDKHSRSAISKTPNIIYILADDLGYGDLGIYGQERFSTPHIDSMARGGMIFTNHYAGSTVCAPSRSTLMTGMHTGHTPIRGNKEIMPEGQWPLPDSVITLPEILKSKGYVTGAFGKWGLGYPGSEGDPVNQGFDEFFGYNCQRQGHHYYPYHLWHNYEKWLLEANTSGGNVTYAPDLIHEKALEFIRRNRDTSFFLYYPSIIPHAELFAPEEYMQKFRGKFDHEIAFSGTDYGDEHYRMGPYGSQPEGHAAFAAMISLLDDQVGEILTLLKTLGISENTLVIFSSDNGPHREGGADPDYFDSNSIFRGYKRDLYEGGIRVPMIAFMPGKIRAGSSTDHVSAFWDLFPTLTDLLNIGIPANIDGISFLPTLFNEEGQETHEYLYWEFHEKGGRIAIRKNNWKGVRYNVLTDSDSRFEVYDLSKDPSESNDLAEEYPEIVEELVQLMKDARTNSEIFSFSSETFLDSK